MYTPRGFNFRYTIDMNFVAIVIMGVALGLLTARFFYARRYFSILQNASVEKNSFIQKEIQKKQQNIKQIKEYLRWNDVITNNEVEKLVGVSDATATRYLEELELFGVVRQVGKEGSAVHYKKTNI